MFQIVPSAYMTIRVKSIKDFLKAIPEKDRHSFIPSQLPTKTESKTKEFVLNRIAGYLNKNGLIIRLNGHYKINDEDEVINGYLKGVYANDEEVKKHFLRKYLDKFEELKHIQEAFNNSKSTTVKNLQNFIQNTYGKEMHKEQIKFIFNLFQEAGLGEYKQFQNAFYWSKSYQRKIETVIEKKIEKPNLSMTTIIELNGKIIRKVIESDKNKILQSLTKEELLEYIKNSEIRS